MKTNIPRVVLTSVSRVGDMAEVLALTAPPEDPGLIHYTLMVAFSNIFCQSQGI